jgi:transcriptional regulator of acetoin/glycerol metabolism
MHSPTDASPPSLRTATHGLGPIGSLLLHRIGLAPTAHCRSPGALRKILDTTHRPRTEALNHEIQKERQREGIAKARAEGKYKGRKPTARAKAPDVLRLYQDGNHVSQIAKALGISRTPVYRALDQAGTDGRGNGRRAA